jgi:hypothetical protein
VSLAVIRERILHAQIASPQNTLRAERALRELEDSLNALSAMGHRLYVTEQPQAELSEWPRMVYHLEVAPAGRYCPDIWTFWELGPDWFFTYADAQHASGMRAQMAGRGGVFVGGLPAATDLVPGPDDSAERKAETIRKFREQRAAAAGAAIEGD